MSARFEELDYRPTPMGDLVLRRRLEPRLNDREVYEVKLGEEFLMSSLFTDGEVALADLGLAAAEGAELDIVVGGLGLGYTAAAALAHESVREMLVVDAMEAVIDWHERGLVPAGPQLTGDDRCRLVHGDFFALAAPGGAGFDPSNPQRKFHAVLLDIDHTPKKLLRPGNAALYTPEGLAHLAGLLLPGGVFAMWSDDPPEADFQQDLAGVFETVQAHDVTFPNLFTDSESFNTVYVAKRSE